MTFPPPPPSNWFSLSVSVSLVTILAPRRDSIPRKGNLFFSPYLLSFLLSIFSPQFCACSKHEYALACTVLLIRGVSLLEGWPHVLLLHATSALISEAMLNNKIGCIQDSV